MRKNISETFILLPNKTQYKKLKLTIIACNNMASYIYTDEKFKNLKDSDSLSEENIKECIHTVEKYRKMQELYRIVDKKTLIFNYQLHYMKPNKYRIHPNEPEENIACFYLDRVYFTRPYMILIPKIGYVSFLSGNNSKIPVNSLNILYTEIKVYYVKKLDCFYLNAIYNVLNENTELMIDQELEFQSQNYMLSQPIVFDNNNEVVKRVDIDYIGSLIPNEKSIVLKSAKPVNCISYTLDKKINPPIKPIYFIDADENKHY